MGGSEAQGGPHDRYKGSALDGRPKYMGWPGFCFTSFKTIVGAHILTYLVSTETRTNPLFATVILCGGWI